jgi:hypothetical protein
LIDVIVAAVVLEVFVIGVDFDWMFYSQKEVLLAFESKDDYQKFSVVDIVAVFCG